VVKNGGCENYVGGENGGENEEKKMKVRAREDQIVDVA
jgi:hypothetical protein